MPASVGSDLVDVAAQVPSDLDTLCRHLCHCRDHLRCVGVGQLVEELPYGLSAPRACVEAPSPLPWRSIRATRTHPSTRASVPCPTTRCPCGVAWPTGSPLCSVATPAMRGRLPWSTALWQLSPMSRVSPGRIGCTGRQEPRLQVGRIIEVLSPGRSRLPRNMKPRPPDTCATTLLTCEQREFSH